MKRAGTEDLRKTARDLFDRAVRAADPTTIVVADGTSCRHQIADGAGREALHAVRVLDRVLASGTRAEAG